MKLDSYFILYAGARHCFYGPSKKTGKDVMSLPVFFIWFYKKPRKAISKLPPKTINNRMTNHLTHGCDFLGKPSIERASAGNLLRYPDV
ncbi:hypothetical protein M1K46_18685 [Fictibacillus sp. WQ 8-8]|uniref:hypothetical protein n=1 Tax=Fictibacillus sp. WQ 8-8 TaxID=2938788 RepID=UPI00210ABC4D|nr:hypothetical protein [Fictibacillus sp. WQ 8-8]MCQ6267663.1 hypothetical protein [Fictibacillus sp. WQ 8-8]